MPIEAHKKAVIASIPCSYGVALIIPATSVSNGGIGANNLSSVTAKTSEVSNSPLFHVSNH